MKEELSLGLKLKQHINLFLFILVIGSTFGDLFSQKTQTKPTRQSSFEAFSKGNFEQAYHEFSELLLTYSKDPLYKYYSGVCLVKLNREPFEAENLIKQAIQSAAVIKTLPSDALFYLGRAQQMSGRFVDAIESYNLYTGQVGKKAAREQGVPDFVQQCHENNGQLAEIKPADILNNETVAIDKTENAPDMKEVISQPVEKETSLKMALPISYNKILDEALEFQFKADSLSTLAAEKKKELETLPNAEKPALKMKISDYELLAASFQKSADQKYDEARVAMNPQQEKVKQTESVRKSDNNVIKDSIKQSENEITKYTVNQSDIKFNSDTIKHNENKTARGDYRQPDTIKEMVSEVKKPVETFTYFQVLAKPVSDPKEKIKIDPEVPAGLIYRIQIAVFRNLIAPAYFKGITPVYGFKIPGTDKTNYYAGMFRRSSDANKALASVKAKGFKDAFVVAFTGKKTVSADRAVILEREWGVKPFISLVNSVPETPNDTIPPTLSFRVEVIRTLKPLKDDVIEGIMKMASNRGLDIQTLDDGKITYLIGNFITFESAEEYANLLIRNGYREARVVAWLGKKEIPVDMAKQLFENPK